MRAFTQDQLWLVFIQLPALDGSAPEVEQRVVVAPEGKEGAALCHALLGSYGQVIAVVSLPQLHHASSQHYKVTNSAHAWPAWFSKTPEGYVVWLRGEQGLFAVNSLATSSAEALLSARIAHPDSSLVLVGSASDGAAAVKLLEGIYQVQDWTNVHYDLRSGRAVVVVNVGYASTAQQALDAALQGWSQSEQDEWERSHLVAMGVNPDEE